MAKSQWKGGSFTLPYIYENSGYYLNKICPELKNFFPPGVP